MDIFSGLEVGDLLFKEVRKDSGIGSKIVAWATGDFVHVGIMGRKRTIFETDGGLFKAQYRDIERYANKKFEIWRWRNMTGEHREKIMKLCDKYQGTPYGYEDILVHAFTFFLAKNLRYSIQRKLGTKKFAKCDEMSKTIFHKGTEYEAFRDYETGNPFEMRQIVIDSGEFELIRKK